MEIKWQQRDPNKLIISIKKKQEERHFLLNDTVINYLAAHKQVHLHVIVNGSEEESCLVNFNGIRPAARIPEGGYSVRNLNELQHEPATSDKCAIARGDTFGSRWLTPRGWSAEKHYFALKPADPADAVGRIACPACGKSIPAASRFCGYCGTDLRQATGEVSCNNTACARSIKSTARFCPYCGSRQSQA